MIQKTKLKKSYLGAIGMSLVLLLVNSLGLLLGTGVGQITPPSTDTWENHIATPTGDASESNPWLINSAENLAYLINNLNDRSEYYYIELASDIDLAGHNWVPIKTANKNVKVHFDGKGHTIANLTIDSERSVALFEEFSYQYEAEILFYNTTFTNVDINSDGTASVVSCYTIKGTIENVIVASGNVVGSELAGGLAPMFWGSMKNCVNNANITSRNVSAGGLGAWGGDYENCINTGTITGGAGNGDGSSGTLGGITAFGSVNNCFSSGTLIAHRGNSVVGGVVGYAATLLVNSGFYGDIIIEGEAKTVGAITGGQDDDVDFKNCFGVASVKIHNSSVDISSVLPFGAVKSNIQNSYSYTKVYPDGGRTKEYRKYVGDNFDEFAYHKNINGGYPFPKTLFAVGQFIDSDVMGYLEEYGFGTSLLIKNDGTHYYVELGQYPQTWVGSSMNTTLENWYSGKPVVDTYTIDNGTSATPNVHNAYKYTDGNTYVRVKGIARDSDSHFKDGTKITTGTIYWFKVEPIKWWVLNYTDVQNGANPIVISERGLTANVTWNKSTSDQNLWASKSNIRTWLNSTFYNDAFDIDYKDYIKTTTVKNNSQSSNDDGTGTDTQDNVWLLSYTEVNGKYEYLNTADKRICIATDFCGAQNSVFQNSTNSACPWWLRSAYASNTLYAQYVNSYSNLTYYYVDRDYYAVRPALTLNL